MAQEKDSYDGLTALWLRQFPVRLQIILILNDEAQKRKDMRKAATKICPYMNREKTIAIIPSRLQSRVTAGSLLPGHC